MTTEIPLSQGFVAIVDDADAARVLSAGKWTAKPNGRTVYAYRQVRQPDGRRRPLLLHTFLTGYPMTDHRDGDGLNNTRSNLREATGSQNAHNAGLRQDNTSGYRGVSWHKGNRRWGARIMHLKRTHILGQYATAEDAARAYDEAARELHGAFARLNFPEEGR
jgi:hypothetical protein